MKRKIFYGWWLLIPLVLACIVHAGVPYYVFGIFYKPLSLEFGWSRSEIALIVTIALLTQGLSSPIIGKLTEIFSPKKIIIAGAAIGGICFILASRATSLWQFYLLYFVVGWCYSACGAVPVSAIVTKWFVDKRGLALGIAVAGISLGAFIIVPVGAYFLTLFGWRDTYLFLAATSFLLVVPPALFLIRDTPEEMGLLPYGDGSQPAGAAMHDSHANVPAADTGEEDWTLKSAMLTGAFWFVCISVCMVYIGVGSVLQHLINYLSDMGISLTSAAFALGLTGVAGALGKILFGYLCDRFPAKYVAVFSFAMEALGIFILIFAKSMTLVWFFVIIFGLSMGGQFALQPLVTVYFFGLRSFATIYGFVYMLASIGSSSGPYIAALIYDKTGSYYYAFIIFVAMALLASLIMLSARRASPPGKVTLVMPVKR